MHRQITPSPLLSLCRLLFRSLLAGACMAPALLPVTGHAQQGKGVTVIVPFAPGGNLDLNARIIATLVKPYVSDPWIVLNRPGATGNLGLAEAMRARPDGKTISLTGGAFLLQGQTADVPWKDGNDFEQIAIVLASYNPHFVRTDAPWKTMTELVEYSKKNPGKVNYGVVGPHGVGTVRYLLLKAATGIDWAEIPYGGDAATITALLGGHIDTGSAAAAGIASQVRAGKIRVLAMPAAERSPNMPDVPTFREQGYNVVLPSFNLILGPKGIPADVLRPMVSAIERATATAEYRKFADDSGADLYTRTGEQMRTTLNSEGATYRTVAPMLLEYVKTHPVK